ncbi:hypothetical protein [Acetobacterium malicum]|uniref:hypothetical protein n=1 Tax=Acetobacterium malicum TaxID=52692 RepID=UPI000424256E|nr:hypothetical protein [Acetobacterium dehalogenans]
MEISQAAIKIIILIIPGLIFFKCYNKITGSKNSNDWESIFMIIFVSIVCYFATSILCSIRDSFYYWQPTLYTATNLKALTDESINPDFFEIIQASLIGFLLALIISKLDDINWINKIANYFNINFKIGDQDVWTEFIKNNSHDYLTIRDYKTGYYYTATIEVYSESEAKRELVINDVDVYDSDNGEMLYNVEKMYLSRSEDDLVFETNSYDTGNNCDNSEMKGGY